MLNWKISLTYMMAGVVLPVLVWAEPEVRLLTTGTFHGDDAPFARDGAMWTAVTVTDKGSDARAVPLRVALVRDDMVDAEDGPMTGLEVSADGEPLFLVEGVKVLEGALPTYIAAVTPVVKGVLVNVVGTAGKWQLMASGEGDAYRLVVRGTGFHAEIMDVEMLDDTAPAVWWAGDLNGDGVPDMVLDVSKKYSNRILVLYLSEPSDLGPALRKVAVLDTVGC